MADFNVLQQKLQQNVSLITTGEPYLFTVDADKDKLWELYLENFPAGANEIFRERREHDCSCCRHFVKQYGAMIAIKQDGAVKSIWDFDAPEPYATPVAKMREYIHSLPVSNVFYAEKTHIGTARNYDDKDSEILWEHFNLSLDPGYVKKRADIPSALGSHRSDYDVFKRALNEITADAVNTVLELIDQNTLYRGTEHRASVHRFKNLKEQCGILPDAWVWRMTPALPPSVSHIRNTSIGTLLVDLSEGVDLETAVRKYESVVAPANYKRPKALFTQRMIDDAKQKVYDLGLQDSLGRRFARISDISARDVLYLDRDSAREVKDAFASLSGSVQQKPQDLPGMENVGIEDFLSKWLPSAQKVELMMSGSLARNRMALIAPQDADAPPLFYWGNNFSWAYQGNLADSDISRNVAKAGGSLEGILRFSIQWNDGEVHNACDYDAHCIFPGGHIYFGDKRLQGGALDVDIISPAPRVPAVENIVFQSLQDGVYEFKVHCYSARGGNTGFKYEMDCNGDILRGEFDKPLTSGSMTSCVVVDVKNGKPSVRVANGGATATNTFQTVSAIMLSPNYWGGKQQGNKHYFFMMKDVPYDETPNGFFNEYLRPELQEHRKVFEALGSQMRVQPDDQKLSGFGFSSTLRNEAVARITGATKRVIKIMF